MDGIDKVAVPKAVDPVGSSAVVLGEAAVVLTAHRHQIGAREDQAVDPLLDRPTPEQARTGQHALFGIGHVVVCNHVDHQRDAVDSGQQEAEEAGVVRVVG
jgi:hypothetical protein